jgi:hypothetical protein
VRVVIIAPTLPFLRGPLHTDAASELKTFEQRVVRLCKAEALEGREALIVAVRFELPGAIGHEPRFGQVRRLHLTTVHRALLTN